MVVVLVVVVVVVVVAVGLIRLWMEVGGWRWERDWGSNGWES